VSSPQNQDLIPFCLFAFRILRSLHPDMLRAPCPTASPWSTSVTSMICGCGFYRHMPLCLHIDKVNVYWWQKGKRIGGLDLVTSCPLAPGVFRNVSCTSRSLACDGCEWRMPSSGMLCRVAVVRTEVSEELIASIIKVTRIGELWTTLALTSNRRTLRRNTNFMIYDDI
jgi:hypothetical protein